MVDAGDGDAMQTVTDAASDGISDAGADGRSTSHDASEEPFDEASTDAPSEAALDALSETAETESDADWFRGPPRINAVFPQTVVSGHNLIISGANFSTPSGNIEGVRVTLEGDQDSGQHSINLDILAASPAELLLATPDNLDELLPGPDELVVRTPLGFDHTLVPLFVVADNGFGGDAATDGLLGIVYALAPNTSRLPNLGQLSVPAAACADTSVVTDANAGINCPFTNIFVPNLSLPSTNFSSGFPGVTSGLVEWFAIRFRGLITLGAAGVYDFETCSDDGSNVYLSQAPVERAQATGSADPALVQVVNNDGLHSMACAGGSFAVTTPGTYAIVIDYFQGPRTEVGLQLNWRPPSGVKQIIPGNVLQPFLP